MHEKSITLLNKAVADELSAVHQYMYFHFHCDDQGYDLLAGTVQADGHRRDAAHRKAGRTNSLPQRGGGVVASAAVKKSPRCEGDVGNGAADGGTQRIGLQPLGK